MAKALGLLYQIGSFPEPLVMPAHWKVSICAWKEQCAAMQCVFLFKYTFSQMYNVSNLAPWFALLFPCNAMNTNALENDTSIESRRMKTACIEGIQQSRMIQSTQWAYAFYTETLNTEEKLFVCSLVEVQTFMAMRGYNIFCRQNQIHLTEQRIANVVPNVTRAIRWSLKRKKYDCFLEKV